MPPSDPEMTRLVEKAERIKARNQRDAEREAKRHAPKVFPSLEMERLRAYRALYPHPPTYLWLFGFMTVLAGLIASLLDHIFTNDKLIFGGLSALFLLYGFVKGSIMPIIWYLFHRGWRKRLPFTLNGWEDFGSSHLLDSWYWRDLTITISSPTSGNDFQTALDAAMTILRKDIVNVTYKGQVGEPSRREWKWDGKRRSITGSANSQVLGLLSDFFRSSLTDITRGFSAHMTVTITPDGDWYRVEGKPMGQTVMG